MALTVRPATVADVPSMANLLMQDARQRNAADPVLWALADNALASIEGALVSALATGEQPFRQTWCVAEGSEGLLGVMHAILLPVPPIYAGRFGMPGLLMPDSFVAQNAPAETVDALVEAAEADLHGAGAQILISSFVTGEAFRLCFERRGYQPLTLYLARTNLELRAEPTKARPATVGDVPGIVLRSAQNRKTLFDLDPFWEMHPAADLRFEAWMQRSLTLSDRDMRVMGTADDLTGYVVAQPASRLHFPPAHDIAGIGVIDDYYHTDFADAATLANGGAGATALLRAAEAAFAERGKSAVFVVCPAAWHSKIALLEGAGYETAMVWAIKR